MIIHGLPYLYVTVVKLSVHVREDGTAVRRTSEVVSVNLFLWVGHRLHHLPEIGRRARISVTATEPE
jgi:hypothetical protein